MIDMNLLDYSNPNSSCQAVAQFSVAIFLDLCVPKSCSGSKDLTELGRAVAIRGNRPVCTADSIIEQGRKKNYQTWIVVAVLVAIGIVAACGTIFDYFGSSALKSRYSKNKWIQCMLAFSVYTNICQIFDTTNVNKPGQIGPIHFMRLISMCWVVLGHVSVMTISVSGNTLDTIKGFKDVSTGFLTNSYFSVDTFFFMSGLLLGFVWFKGYYRNPKRQLSTQAWIMFYVHRFLRLSPPYYLVIAFYTFVFNTFVIHMPNLLMGYKDSCDRNWWINLLYLTNYIDYKNQCYLISWYLATDIQMYIFAPVILIPLAIKPLYGFITAAGIFIASTAGNMITVYRYYFPPSDFSFGAQDPRMKDFNVYTLMMYDAPWIRCQVYIIGILTGYLLQTRKKLRIPFLVNIALWIISLGLGLTVILVLKDWVNGKLLSLTESAFYSAFSRIAWGLALAYITASCYYGYGGPINRFMSWSIWAPFGRLTYCGYLVHVMVVFYMLGMGDSQIIYTNFSYTFVTTTLPGIVFTFFFALFWSALFEIPTAKVEGILLGGLRGRETVKQKPESDNSVTVRRVTVNETPVILNPPKVIEETATTVEKDSSVEKL
uniref:Acyl_transf_3 domain-containing protein n=1 Tax=Syphacia muris TaxID=451379 RepID=A0A0N5AVS8_9BILA